MLTSDNVTIVVKIKEKSLNKLIGHSAREIKRKKETKKKSDKCELKCTRVTIVELESVHLK